MINSYYEALDFEVPEKEDESAITWRLWIDTSLEAPRDIREIEETSEISRGNYNVSSHSLVILVHLK
jgi:hypothetical protein